MMSNFAAARAASKRRKLVHPTSAVVSDSASAAASTASSSKSSSSSKYHSKTTVLSSVPVKRRTERAANLAWKNVVLPSEFGFDEEGGLLELEEVEGVDVVYRDGLVTFRVSLLSSHCSLALLDRMVTDDLHVHRSVMRWIPCRSRNR